jgi:aconitate decarboxylase
MTLTTTDHNIAGVTKNLCQWIQDINLEGVPEDVRIRAKYLILDGLACAVVGSHLPWTETAAQTIFSMEPTGKCKVWGYNDKVGRLSSNARRSRMQTNLL